MLLDFSFYWRHRKDGQDSKEPQIRIDDCPDEAVHGFLGYFEANEQLYPNSAILSDVTCAAENVPLDKLWRTRATLLPVAYWCIKMSCLVLQCKCWHDLCIHLTFIYCKSASWLSRVTLDAALPNLKRLTVIANRSVSRLAEDLTARLWLAGLRFVLFKYLVSAGARILVTVIACTTMRHRVCAGKGHQSDSLQRPLSRFYWAIKLFEYSVSFCSQTAWFMHINTARAYQSLHAISR